MGMAIEVIGVYTYTVDLTDEDVEKVKEKLIEKDIDPFCCSYEDVSHAVFDLYSDGEISLYDKEKCVESDFMTEDIHWSEFEEREPCEIFSDTE